ncbi:MAG: tRNA (N6-isopentenyl adenosine(37)-C2)-methylthiotransferase MiaB [Nitrospirota bacterium]
MMENLKSPVQKDKILNVITFGCQMNKYDSETITGLLQDYSLTDKPEEANLILINTCAVRQHAEDKVYSLLGRLSKIKKTNPALKIGICGCMAEQYGAHLLKRFPVLDLVVGPDNIYKLPDLLDELYKDKRIVLTGHNEASLPSGEACLVAVSSLPIKREACLVVDKIKAYLPIVLGCNNRCTYCVVPSTRGSIRSRPPQQILNEIENLANSGYQEITLLGQNVNDYGTDFKISPPPIDFLKLLIMINEINGLKRIRFITSHPKNFNHTLIDALPQLQKVCEYIHLPLQSGSNKILKLMNRGYTIEFYQQLVEYIRQKIPNVSITTDLIVGFPGEEEEDFNQTLKAVEEIKFDSAFTFKYSPRPNTPSATYPDQLTSEVKQNRLGRLIANISRITKEKNSRLIERIEEILVEGRNPRDTFFLMGRTRTDKIIFFKASDDSLIGKLVKVKIISCGTFSFKGELL